MAVYDDLVQRVLRMLNDPSGRQHNDSIIYDAVCAAHEAILPWVPKQAVTTLTSGSDGVSLVLPADVYQIMTLQRVETGEIIVKATMAPKTYRTTEDVSLDWIDYPYQTITLNQDVGEGEDFNVYYLAHWNQPTSETDGNFVIEVPAMAHMGMCYYASSHCLIPKAVNSANIRQFNQRIDSGTPEDNPLKVEGDWMLQRFHQEMKLMPPYAKIGI